MSDKVFQWSLTGLTVLILFWVVLGSTFIMGWFPAALIGLVVGIGSGGALLYYWGKNYMEKG